MTDEEKAEDRLEDENDAMELVNATTTMLSVTHEEDTADAKSSPKASDPTASPAQPAGSPATGAGSGAHTPAAMADSQPQSYASPAWQPVCLFR